MLQYILIAVGVAIGGLLAYAATRPNTSRISRATTIRATPAAIYALIEDFRRWQAWSPWERLDPGMQRTHSGAAHGTGAIYEWNGNNKVGAGRMEITAAQAPSQVTIKLDFLRPFEAHNITEFTVEPSGNATRITWTMHAQNNFMSKLFGIFVNMDKLVGADFEKGLENLRAQVEQ